MAKEMPFLVVVQQPHDGPELSSIARIFIAYVATREEALEAVSGAVPQDWKIDRVMGVGLPSLVERRGLRPGSVEELAG